MRFFSVRKVRLRLGESRDTGTNCMSLMPVYPVLYLGLAKSEVPALVNLIKKCIGRTSRRSNLKFNRHVSFFYQCGKKLSKFGKESYP